MVYGLSCFAEIRDKKKLKIMSVGCGPCTELAAVDYLRNEGVLNYDQLDYRGIDPLGEVWQPIWNDIIDYFGDGIRFYPNDILQLVDIIVQKSGCQMCLFFNMYFRICINIQTKSK